jgi:hypothetical protein
MLFLAGNPEAHKIYNILGEKTLKYYSYKHKITLNMVK